LNALQEFNLWGCLNLKKLLKSIGQLSALQKLQLSERSSLNELPTPIGVEHELLNHYIHHEPLEQN
jgi:hypothetical protein